MNAASIEKSARLGRVLDLPTSRPRPLHTVRFAPQQAAKFVARLNCIVQTTVMLVQSQVKWPCVVCALTWTFLV